MKWFGIRNFKTFFSSIQNHSLMVVVNCDTQKNSRFLDQVDLHKNRFQFPLHFPQHWFNTTLILKGEPYHILPTFHKKIFFFSLRSLSCNHPIQMIVYYIVHSMRNSKETHHLPVNIAINQYSEGMENKIRVVSNTLLQYYLKLKWLKLC